MKFKDILDHNLREWQDEKDKSHKNEKGKYYVSELVVGCLKKSYLSKIEPAKITRTQLRYFSIGTIFHNFIEELFKDFDSEVKFEKKFDDFLVKGRIDLMNKEYIVEIKTCSKVVLRPREEHLAQLNFYLGMAERKKGMLVYINKNNFEIYQFEFSFNKLKFQENILFFKKLHGYLEKKEIPQTKPIFSCFSCPYHSICFNEAR